MDWRWSRRYDRAMRLRGSVLALFFALEGCASIRAKFREANIRYEQSEHARAEKFEHARAEKAEKARLEREARLARDPRVRGAVERYATQTVGINCAGSTSEPGRE